MSDPKVLLGTCTIQLESGPADVQCLFWDDFPEIVVNATNGAAGWFNATHRPTGRRISKLSFASSHMALLAVRFMRGQDPECPWGELREDSSRELMDRCARGSLDIATYAHISELPEGWPELPLPERTEPEAP